MINQESFLTTFTDQLDCNDQSIGFDTRFEEIDDWNSLTGLAVIAAMRDVYGVRLNLKDIERIGSVGELYEFVNKSVEQNAAI